MKIFISHSSKDKIIIESFVENILVQGCKLSEESIFCTSIEGIDIETGKDFREYIRNRLLNSDYAFLMISENYLDSQVCLNEMGACWALDSIKVLPYLINNLNFESMGTLMGVRQGAKIDNSAKLDELYEMFTGQNGKKGSLARWNKHKNDFLESLRLFVSTENAKPYPDPEVYFKQFLIPNVNINHLMLCAHPTLMDCKKVFKEEYYGQAFQNYCKVFEKLVEELSEPMYPRYKYFEVNSMTVYELLDKKQGTGGLIEMALKGFFNYDVIFYEVNIRENRNSGKRITYRYFTYVNDRWVFLWAPWRL
ncbi:toll/interleukin-1 receptor domain-containing protein [Flagellimonas aurea]|uniref:toll/interleukin-1 receptor domain-containing protein n=1 Tax=Flagellimonas aurea TaxID=2915619 RepID=UPI0035CFCF01